MRRILVGSPIRQSPPVLAEFLRSLRELDTTDLALDFVFVDDNDDPASAANRAAWEVLKRWDKPFLTAFSDQDPITRGAERLLQRSIPGAAGRVHPTIAGGGHFLQEDCGEALARVVIEFLRR